MAMRTSSLVALVKLAAASAQQASPLAPCLASHGRVSFAPAASRHITTGSPTAQQGKDGDGRSTVFTGTADVKTDKSPEDVATDSNRRWVAEDDLGTRAEAALDTAAEKTGRNPESQPGNGSEQQPEAAAEVLANDEACHPADPYCTVGEAAPRSDDFHEEGDGTTPPSSGFPA